MGTTLLKKGLVFIGRLINSIMEGDTPLPARSVYVRSLIHMIAYEIGAKLNDYEMKAVYSIIPLDINQFNNLGDFAASGKKKNLSHDELSKIKAGMLIIRNCAMAA